MTAPELEAAKAGPLSNQARAFRRCLGEFATGVTVVTAEVGERRYGITANSFSSLSIDPPLILWSISRTSRSFAAFTRADRFAINVLRSDQIELSQRFSSGADDKFEGVSWSAGKNGSPILEGVAAYLECRRVTAFDGGDHVIIIGQVDCFSQTSGEVLLFVQGRYCIPLDHPSMKGSEGDSRGASRPAGGGAAVPIYMLIFRAFHRLSELFDVHRRAEGVNLAQARVLIGLDERPGISSEDLVRTMFLTAAVVEDAVAELSDRRLVARGPGGELWLTALGHERRQALARREGQFDAEQTKGMDAAEVETVRRFLTKLVDRTAGW